ncbi:MAG: hypothetical protein H6R24_58 [Proteobacteria bacterium]|nr:hypothetical protein [Pseudomonadota bacterium]
MFGLFQNWRRRRQLERARLPEAEWQATVANLPALVGMTPAELEQLRDLATLFLAEKALEPAGELELAPEMGPLIAAQACLPILKLGLDYYQDWSAVILYPEGFLAHHEYTDANGLVHSVHRPLIGEAWERGPVIAQAGHADRCSQRPAAATPGHDGAKLEPRFQHRLRTPGPAGGPGPTDGAGSLRRRQPRRIFRRCQRSVL